MFKINLQYDEYHVIFPRIILTILIILLLMMFVKFLYKFIKEKKQVNFRFKFFGDNFDKFKFFGTAGLLIVYVLMLEIIGFIISSIGFMFLLTVLLRGDFKRNTLMISVINSVTTSVIVWFFFGYLFDITLP
ncbi:tripartite tricarboxylate transporter TctB family protein [Bacillus sp. B15-48]|nr:tripartite tricarboxylate transporter TctB family protein [Bacillus sp. B15-48]